MNFPRRKRPCKRNKDGVIEKSDLRRFVFISPSRVNSCDEVTVLTVIFFIPAIAFAGLLILMLFGQFRDFHPGASPLTLILA